MSRLNELIERLCPNGVEYVKLDDILINNNAEITIPKKEYKKDGKIPIIDQSQSYYSGYTDNERAIPQKLPCIIFGDHTRVVKYTEKVFAQGDSGTKVFVPVDEEISTKYIYYAFSNLNIPSRGYNRHWTIAKELTIPLPPLAIQYEIVRILDNFTELIAELTAELTARKKQYEYYRDLLLTFGDEVPKVRLGECCDIEDNKRKPVKSSLRIPGDTPYYGANNIQDYVEGYTHYGQYVLIAEDGSASLENYSVQYVDGFFWANNHVHVIKGRKDLDTKFLYYYLTSFNFIPFLTGGTRAKLNKGNMEKIPIPIPPLPVQQEIVRILDNFTELTAQLTAEIEARQKQYEYYRDKLLSFKEVTG